MEDREENIFYTYTHKIISKVVSDDDEATIKAITRYCEENDVYPNLISAEKMKEVIELGLKSETLQEELSKANEKLKKIEEMFNNNNLNKYYYGDSYEFEITEFKEDVLKIIKGEEE